MLHLKWLSSALMLLMLAGGVNGQIVGAVLFGENITKEQEASAKAIIRQLEANNFQWNVGDFQIFQKGASAKGELTWDISDETILEIKDIPPDTRLMIDNAIRAGETTAKDHDFPAQKTSYWKFKGTKAGTTNVSIYGVSEDKLRVVRIAKMKITVGPKIPDIPPPPPPDDPLVKSFRNAIAVDVAANKADKKHLLALSGIYDAASKDSLDSLATMNDLDARLVAARTSAGIPDPDVMYPNLRKAVQAELYSQLGVNVNSGTVELKADTRRLAKAVMAKIATSLMEVAK